MEQIENYLFASMSFRERAQFEARLQQDLALNVKVEELNSVFNGIKDAGRYEKMNTWHKVLEHTSNRSTFLSVVNSRVWMVAATLLVCCVGIWLVFFSNSKEEQLFAKYYKADFGLVTAMSATDNFAFDKAMIDYKSGNYKMSINAWQQILAQRPNSDTLHYFIGSSYLALKNYQQATASFKKVVAIKQSSFVQDAYWYLGLAALHLGNTKDASAYISKSDHSKKQALLQDLKR